MTEPALSPCPFCGKQPLANTHVAWCDGAADFPHALIQLPREDWNRRATLAERLAAAPGKDTIQREREEAFKVGWDDGYAEGYGKAGLETQAALSNAEHLRLTNGALARQRDHECERANLLGAFIRENDLTARFLAWEAETREQA